MTTKELSDLLKEQEVSSSELFQAINRNTSEKIAKYLLDAQIEKITFPKHLPPLQISYLCGNGTSVTKEIHSISLTSDRVEIEIIGQLLHSAQVIVSLVPIDIIPQSLERVYEALTNGDLNQHIQYQRSIETTQHHLISLPTDTVTLIYRNTLKAKIKGTLSHKKPNQTKELENPLQLTHTKVTSIGLHQSGLRLNDTQVPWSDLNTSELEQILLSIE